MHLSGSVFGFSPFHYTDQGCHWLLEPLTIYWPESDSKKILKIDPSFSICDVLGTDPPFFLVVFWLIFNKILGKRPYGVSLLYAGWDLHHGFQLYQSDPSGNYTGWFATCVGKNQQTAVSHFKQESKDNVENMTLEDAKKLVMKVIFENFCFGVYLEILENFIRCFAEHCWHKLFKGCD